MTFQYLRAFIQWGPKRSPEQGCLILEDFWVAKVSYFNGPAGVNIFDKNIFWFQISMNNSIAK